jgi:hypothetical protein
MNQHWRYNSPTYNIGVQYNKLHDARSVCKYFYCFDIARDPRIIKLFEDRAHVNATVRHSNLHRSAIDKESNNFMVGGGCV